MVQRLSAILWGAGLLGTTVMSQEALAGGLNPWGGRLADGSAAITPYVYVLSDGEVDPYAYVQASFAGHLDILVGAGGSIRPGEGGSFGVVDLMPRFFINDSLGLTFRVLAGPDDTPAYGPEVHAVWVGETVGFTLNAGYRVDDETGSAFGLLVPEVFLGSRLSLFIEVDPTYTLGDGGGTSLLLVPGVGMVLDRAGKHTAALGVQVDALAPAPPSYGVWYSTGFGS